MGPQHLLLPTILFGLKEVMPVALVETLYHHDSVFKREGESSKEG
jgi:hypothetical protein